MQKIKIALNVTMTVASIVSGICGIVIKSTALASELKRG